MRILERKLAQLSGCPEARSRRASNTLVQMLSWSSGTRRWPYDRAVFSCLGSNPPVRTRGDYSPGQGPCPGSAPAGPWPSAGSLAQVRARAQTAPPRIEPRAGMQMMLFTNDFGVWTSVFRGGFEPHGGCFLSAAAEHVFRKLSHHALWSMH